MQSWSHLVKLPKLLENCFLKKKTIESPEEFLSCTMILDIGHLDLLSHFELLCQAESLLLNLHPVF